jgi:FMN reductase (NADPH)
VVELLGLPRLMFPLFGLTVGWPAMPAETRPRLPQRAILHWESYSRAHEDDALQEYDRTMSATGNYDNRQVPVPGRPGEMENYGWLEHSARRVSRPTRVEVGRVLREQGFDLE